MSSSLPTDAWVGLGADMERALIHHHHQILWALILVPLSGRRRKISCEAVRLYKMVLKDC